MTKASYCNAVLAGLQQYRSTQKSIGARHSHDGVALHLLRHLSTLQQVI